MLVTTLKRGVFTAVCGLAALAVASEARAQQVQTVFVIAMENHNFAQPNGTSPQQILGNPAAPYINSLITPGSPNAAQVSFATNYQNSAPGVHPSEPNYIWAEAGSNLGVFNDNDPFAATGGTEKTTSQNLSNYLQIAGHSWKSYQEDTDIDLTSNTVLPQSQWTVPLSSHSGNFTTGVNAYNGSTQYNYAAKHNPMVFFTSTSGGNNPTPSNPLTVHYAPLQQLLTDLANNTVAQYNWITPDQYNDQHSALTGGFSYQGTKYTGDQAAIAQGDNFLSILVPQIMASQAYKNNGMIVIWWDETEGGDTPAFTIPEIIVSPNTKGNAYSNNILYTHSSDLLTMQELFSVGPCLGAACGANDLSDLLKPASIPALLTVGTGACIPFPVTLAAPAGPNGVFLTLTTSNPSTLTLENNLSSLLVFFPAGSTTPAGRMPQVCGVKFGTATITSSGGLLFPSQSVEVTAALSFYPTSVTMTTSEQERLTLTLSAPAPAGGVTVNLSSDNPAVATVPPTATFAANSTSVIVPVTGVGTGTTLIHANLSNIPDTFASVTVQ
ncbi:MAG TPA: alkaline phosphatase family protein [Bryobacteraceae bacterium]|nr:alkaline phosphatase family protein [Bryobacteraceae bacterium]